MSPRQRQQNRAAEDQQQIQNMPNVEHLNLKVGIVSSEQMSHKFVQHNKTSSIVTLRFDARSILRGSYRFLRFFALEDFTTEEDDIHHQEEGQQNAKGEIRLLRCQRR